MITWHVVFLIPVLLVQYLFLAALGGLLATFTVFYGDIAQIIPTIFQVIMFTSPILYPIHSMPAVLQALAKYNPFYIISEGFRDSIINHRVPDFVFIARPCRRFGIARTAERRRFSSGQGPV
jgi:lipopolysaccharide transport system permease protein